MLGLATPSMALQRCRLHANLMRVLCSVPQAIPLRAAAPRLVTVWGALPAPLGTALDVESGQELHWEAKGSKREQCERLVRGNSGVCIHVTSLLTVTARCNHQKFRNNFTVSDS